MRLLRVTVHKPKRALTSKIYLIIFPHPPLLPRLVLWYMLLPHLPPIIPFFKNINNLSLLLYRIIAMLYVQASHRDHQPKRCQI